MNTGKFRLSPWVLAFAVLAALGLFGHFAVLIKGQKLFGSSDGVPWNILVSAYAFLAGAAAGVFFWTSVGEIFNLSGIRPLSRTGTLAALAALVPALVAIGSELGRPQRMLGFLLSPNLKSPLWWMAMTYGILLAVLLLKVWAAAKGRTQLEKNLAYPGLFLGLAAPVVLGNLFGSLAARPLWNSWTTPVYFLFLALAIGAAVMLGVAVHAGARSSFRPIGRFLAGTLVLLGAMLAVKVSGADSAHAQLFLSGKLAWAFWGLQIAAGIALPLVVLVTPLAKSHAGVAAAAGLTLVGAFTARVVDLLAGQGLPVMPMLKYQAYSATLTEIAMVAGVLGLAGLLFLAGSSYLAAPAAPQKAQLLAGDD